MIRKQKLRQFLQRHMAPEFDRFHIYQDEMLIRVSSIFVHGVYFQRSRVDDDVYVLPFIDFLSDGSDTIGFTIGTRVRRSDVPTHYQEAFELQPPENAADVITRSIRASKYFPFVAQPTCRSLLDSFAGKLDSMWALYGLACCATMEGERESAADLLKRFDEIVNQFDSVESRKYHVLCDSIVARLNNLTFCRELLWKLCRESVRLRGLERVAELSDWKPG